MTWTRRLIVTLILGVCCLGFNWFSFLILRDLPKNHQAMADLAVSSTFTAILFGILGGICVVLTLGTGLSALAILFHGDLPGGRPSNRATWVTFGISLLFFFIGAALLNVPLMDWGSRTFASLAPQELIRWGAIAGFLAFGSILTDCVPFFYLRRR